MKCFQIRNARIEIVGKYQSCMVSKLRIIGEMYAELDTDGDGKLDAEEVARHGINDAHTLHVADAVEAGVSGREVLRSPTQRASRSPTE